MERRFKAPIGFGISVIAGDYALICVGYTLIIVVGSLLQKRSRGGAIRFKVMLTGIGS